jgi:hypothetical protein
MMKMLQDKIVLTLAVQMMVHLVVQQQTSRHGNQEVLKKDKSHLEEVGKKVFFDSEKFPETLSIVG